MTAEDFRRWRRGMGFTQEAAADALDLGKSTIELYERGSRRDGDRRPVKIPLVVSLACKMLTLRRKQR